MSDELNSSLEPIESTEALPAEEASPQAINPPKSEEAEKNALYRAIRKQQEAEKKLQEALKRQQELEAKVKEYEMATLSEQERVARELEEAKKTSERLAKEAERLQAIVEAGLPPELAKLVPPGIENPREFIEENIMPIKEKLSKQPFGAPTNPSQTMVTDETKHLVDTFNSLKARYGGIDHPVVQEFYNRHAEVLRDALVRLQQ